MAKLREHYRQWSCFSLGMLQRSVLKMSIRVSTLHICTRTNRHSHGYNKYHKKRDKEKLFLAY